MRERLWGNRKENNGILLEDYRPTLHWSQSKNSCRAYIFMYTGKRYTVLIMLISSVSYFWNEYYKLVKLDGLLMPHNNYANKGSVAYIAVNGIPSTGCHLPRGITQCYLSPDTSEHTPP